MIYLCTTGTSAAKLWTNGRFSANTVDELGSVDLAAEALFQLFKDYQMHDEKALTEKLSAEIHSLARLRLTTNDVVVLFSSETLDGQACTESVAKYLKHQGYEVKVEVIKGLQTKDARTFSKEGVVNFIRKILDYVDNFGASQCILNTTGGFKSLVPYTVLLGMIRQVSSQYIFEFSKEIINLPPLPIDFNRNNIESIKLILEKINRESSISIEDFNNILTWENRQRFQVLFENADDEITLSAVGFLILDELQKPTKLTVFLSREAIAGFIKLKQRADIRPEEFLNMVAQDFNKLEQVKHGNAGNGLTWLKPGNTADRYLVSVEDTWKLMVWEIHAHDTYDQRSAIQDLGKKVCEQRKQKYAPFFRLDYSE